MGQPPNVLARKCASRRYLAFVASKWSLLVINALDDGPARNGSLMRKVEGISQKMLTQTLRDLETTGIVKREDHGTVPPHVTYELTPLGKSLRQEVRSLVFWVESNIPELSATTRS
ncbi:helix-turn-helix domain-containing protein [Aquidulcibacter sp.]|jgi:DNA-binding HxlR family transcriptional regulator|uniref:winged helix-turn-helix transcriptional regulator n=1 Tax=Aquidulcibacter sp. TaxID=2052990 RepID=UPI0028A8C6FF|nr:helix-turn-helix domain-containing protein [Aquidulcibacter sp.]